MSLQGKVVAITGASAGIGRATAREMALALARGLSGFEPRSARRPLLPKRAGMALPLAAAESGQHPTGARALEAPFVETADESDVA